MRREWEIRQEMCLIGKELYQKNYIVGHDGNMSVRLPGDVLLSTPSGVCKGELEVESILKTNLEGEIISGSGKRTSEFDMHKVIYEERPDLRAVVHAHPPLSVAFTLAQVPLETNIIPEVPIYLGKIQVAPYATPGTKELAESIRPLLLESDAILLERHGIVAAGRTLTEAFYKIEYVEYTARVLLAARQLGNFSPLPPEEVSKLLTLGKERRKIIE